jgi:hypothetical protein
VEGNKFVRELEKLPFPVPSIVLDARLVEGDEEVFHTIPLAVTLSPPSEEIFPPLVALTKVTLEADVVVNCGTVLEGVNVFSLAQPKIVAITKKSGDFFFIVIGDLGG